MLEAPACESTAKHDSVESAPSSPLIKPKGEGGAMTTISIGPGHVENEPRTSTRSRNEPVSRDLLLESAMNENDVAPEFSMEPTPIASKPHETGPWPRMEYKLSIGYFSRNLEQDDFINVTAHLSREESRLSFINSKYAQDHGSLFVLPEHVRDKLYRTKACAPVYDDLLFMVMQFTCLIVFPIVSIAVLLSAMNSDNNVPSWFPYVGVYFYVIVVPFIPIALYCTMYNGKWELFVEADAASLRKVMYVTVLVCFFCSPLYGIYAAISLPQHIAVDYNTVLYVGGYICCAITLPFVFHLTVAVVNTVPFLFQGKGFLTLSLILLTTSAIHQAVLGQLIWFPYLSVFGWLIMVPYFAAVLVLLVCHKYVWQYTRDHAIQVCSVFAAIVVDIAAYLLVQRDFRLPLQELLADPLVFGGAIMFYVTLTLLTILEMVYVPPDELTA